MFEKSDVPTKNNIYCIISEIVDGEKRLLISTSYNAIYAYIHEKSIKELFLKFFKSFAAYNEHNLSKKQLINHVHGESIYFLQQTAENMDMTVTDMMAKVEELYNNVLESDPELFI